MTVKDLIEALQLRDPNLEVYAYTDHGQTPEKVQYPKVIWADNLDHTLWDGYVGSEEEAEEEGYKARAVLL